MIDALDRPRAAEGDRFAIRGQNFGAAPADNHVFVNGAAVEVLSARHDELVVLVPFGATSGPVSVIVDGQASNTVPLGLYARRATSTIVTDAIPSGPGPVNLTLAGIVVRSGDRVLLSGAPDVLAPLAFTGTLRATVDEGSALQINPSPTAVDVSGEFSPGTHALHLRLEGASVSTAAIHVFVGPNATGAIAGEHSVLTVNHSLPTP